MESACSRESLSRNKEPRRREGEWGAARSLISFLLSFKVLKGCLTYLCGAHLLDRFSLREVELIIIRLQNRSDALGGGYVCRIL